LAIVPATRQVDIEAVAIALGGPVRLATSKEVAEIFADCEWGSLVPFGGLYGLPTLLDEGFDRDSVLVFEAHLHAVAIRLRCVDFERLEKPKRTKLTR
jgi:Ala-tRNA(Pro) deacylase